MGVDRKNLDPSLKTSKPSALAPSPPVVTRRATPPQVAAVRPPPPPPRAKRTEGVLPADMAFTRTLPVATPRVAPPVGALRLSSVFRTPASVLRTPTAAAAPAPTEAAPRSTWNVRRRAMPAAPTANAVPVVVATRAYVLSADRIAFSRVTPVRTHATAAPEIAPRQTALCSARAPLRPLARRFAAEWTAYCVAIAAIAAAGCAPHSVPRA